MRRVGGGGAPRLQTRALPTTAAHTLSFETQKTLITCIKSREGPPWLVPKKIANTERYLVVQRSRYMSVFATFSALARLRARGEARFARTNACII